MTDLRARYAKLIALAEDQADTPEGETAARMAAAMLERFPELQIPEAPPAKRVIATRHVYDQTLLTRIATFLACKAYQVGRGRSDGKGVRWREGLQIEGPPELIELVADFYQEHRKRLDDVLKWTAVGYAVGAFPRLDQEDTGDAQVLTPEQLEAARAGLAAGKRNQAHAPVPESRRLTDARPKLTRS